MILSFDTSNYTTSACLFDPATGVIWQNRILLHPPKDQRGLRQSDVVFLHTKNMESLLETMPTVSIDAVVATARPRPIDGSYMPCFLVGQNMGRNVAKALGCPFQTFSHQENHIMAALYSSGNMSLLRQKFIAFHVSGGTSDVLSVTMGENGLEIQSIGGSNDLHAGQLIDRIGVMLGMQFPCGKEIEATAKQCNEKIAIKTSVTGNFFNLSGFENRAQQLISNGASREYVSKFALDAVLRTVDKVIANLRSAEAELPVLLAGGVMSNAYIAENLLKSHKNIYFSDPFYSSDHALGNAVLYDFLNR